MKLDELTEMIATTQRLAGLGQGQHPRLAVEADVKTDAKTCKRMEDVVAKRVRSGYNSSAVHTDPMCLTSFGDDSNGPPVSGKYGPHRCRGCAGEE